MNIYKSLLLLILSAITILPSCSKKEEVQGNCKCCGGATGGCWDEVMQAGSQSALQAKCAGKTGQGADFRCALD